MLVWLKIGFLCVIYFRYNFCTLFIYKMEWQTVVCLLVLKISTVIFFTFYIFSTGCLVVNMIILIPTMQKSNKKVKLLNFFINTFSSSFYKSLHYYTHFTFNFIQHFFFGFLWSFCIKNSVRQ